MLSMFHVVGNVTLFISFLAFCVVGKKRLGKNKKPLMVSAVETSTRTKAKVGKTSER